MSVQTRYRYWYPGTTRAAFGCPVFPPVIRARRFGVSPHSVAGGTVEASDLAGEACEQCSTLCAKWVALGTYPVPVSVYEFRVSPDVALIRPQVCESDNRFRTALLDYFVVYVVASVAYLCFIRRIFPSVACYTCAAEVAFGLVVKHSVWYSAFIEWLMVPSATTPPGRAALGDHEGTRVTTSKVFPAKQSENQAKVLIVSPGYPSFQLDAGLRAAWISAQQIDRSLSYLVEGGALKEGFRCTNDGLLERLVLPFDVLNPTWVPVVPKGRSTGMLRSWLCLPWREWLFHQFRAGISGENRSGEETFALLVRWVWWPNMCRDILRWHNAHPIHSQLCSSSIGEVSSGPTVSRSLASLRREARWLRYAVRSLREHVRERVRQDMQIDTPLRANGVLNHPISHRGVARVPFEQDWVKALLLLPDGQQRKVWIRRGSDIRRSLHAHDIPSDWSVSYNGLEIPAGSCTVPTSNRVVLLKVPTGSEVSNEWVFRYEGINLPKNVSLLQIGSDFKQEIVLHLHQHPKRRATRGTSTATPCAASAATEKHRASDDAPTKGRPGDQGPTADRAHDHTRGVRIGEARHPGPSSSDATCWTLGGRKLNVEPGAVQRVKEQISDRCGIDVPLQRILFGGRELGDHELVTAGMSCTFVIDRHELPSTECAQCGDTLKAAEQLAEQFAEVPTVDYDKVWVCGVCSFVVCLQCRKNATDNGQRECPSCGAGYRELREHLAASAAPGVTRAVFVKQKATGKCHCPKCLRPCRRKSTHLVCYCDRNHLCEGHRWPCSAFCKKQKGFYDTRVSTLGESSDCEDTENSSTDDGDHTEGPNA